MIKLSDRLQIIADRLGNIKTMADIGTDHGFLPIYLIQSGQCDKVILADISLPSLGKAEENCKTYLGEGCRVGEGIQQTESTKLYEGEYELRAGDGLTVLKNCEVEAVSIAGMGGKLMVDIMAADMEFTRSVKRYVLQPRIGQGYLRKWLLENGFKIVKEDVVAEGRYIPEIITAESPNRKEAVKRDEDTECRSGNDECVEMREIMYRIPPWIIDAEGPVNEFLTRNLIKEENIFESMKLSRERNDELEAEIRENINYLKELLRRYEDEK